MRTETVSERIHNGEREAFNELFYTHWQSLVSYSGLIIGDNTDAQDVVQTVFLNLWTDRSRLRPDTNIDAWLMRSVYNRSLNRLRSNMVRHRYNSWYSAQINRELSVCYDPDRNDVIARLFGEESRQAVDEAISSLPEKCREVFILRYCESLSAKETADRLGLSVSTVNNQVFKALGLLREKLGYLKAALLFLSIYFFD